MCIITSLGYSQSLPIKEKFHLYLLIGQSNMAGRGKVEPSDTIQNQRILSFNKQKTWIIAKEPIGFDKSFTGVGPGLAFGREMAAIDTSIYIGLIPCAHGGSSISVWKTGVYYEPTKSFPLDNAIERAKLAMKVGVLKGIIWNQGESDCTPEKAAVYEESLKGLIDTLRQALNEPNLPFIAAELPAFQINPKTNFAPHKKINRAINHLKKRIDFYSVIKTNDTNHKGDSLHYNTASARLIGERYAHEMKKLITKCTSY